jgi:DNA-binding MarR family transcriptional regulator
MDNMVDDHDIDNSVDVQGWELALLLLGGFRTLVDETHALLAERGHPEARPAHGFALQAVGAGATASQVATRLGVSKQAAAKTIVRLEAQGYVTRTGDPDDARRRTVVATARGRDLLAASATAFDEVVARWRTQADVGALAGALRALDLPAASRLDLGAWVG